MGIPTDDILDKDILIRNIMEVIRVLPSAPLEEILDVALTPLYTSIEELREQGYRAWEQAMGEDL